MKVRFANLIPLIALLLSLLGGAVTVSPVYAANILVETTVSQVGTNGVCALHEAIENANNDAATHPDCAAGSGSDIISFADGLGTLIHQEGIPAITDPDGLTIDGGGDITISGNNFYQVFKITSGAVVTFRDLTITGGNSFAGGGILTQNSTVTLDNVEVSGNTSSGRGGGIYNNGGTLTIQNGSVIGKSGAPNIGCAGGGIFTEGNSAITTLDASTVSYNQSPDCPGGGIYMLYASQLIVQNGSVVSNNLGGDPGDYPTFTDPAGGGGIYGSASPIISISDSTVSNNTASCINNPNCGGGGLKGGSSVTITNSTFSNNTVNCNASTPCGGGGIYNSAALNITNSTFSGNSTGMNGGAIYNHAALNITNSTFSGNSASGSSTSIDGLGGAIYNNGSTTTVTNSTFDDNTVEGFGPANSPGSGYGGAIYASGTLSVTNSTFNANQALGGDFPSCGSSPCPTLTNADGGAIYINSGSGHSIVNTTFNGNVTQNGQNLGYTAPFVGGALAMYASSADLRNSILANSSSPNDCSSSGTINQTNNLIEVQFTCGAPAVTSDPMLDPLGNNGGSTETMALQTGSPAIDAGTNCPATDQRGVSRPQGAACDIGAFELDTTYPTVTATSLQANYTSGPASFTVTFSENVSNLGGGSGINDVENPANYILVEEGTTTGFQTTACNNTDFTQDTQVLINSVSYSPNTATVDLGASLPIGSYRLFVCGTTSIVDPAGFELNNGASDYNFDFIVGSVATVASSLPDTGFAPNRITSLPAQSTHYANLGSIWLEIPKLGLRSEIVGVPQSSDGWNVDWLGNSAGWLNGTAFPSWEGNSVVTAHVYDSNGAPGPFQKIKNLKHGDQVIVHMFGERYIFEVRETSMVSPTKTDYALEHLKDHSYLTLITCQWYNPITDSYAFRRIVRAVLTDVQAE